MARRKKRRKTAKKRRKSTKKGHVPLAILKRRLKKLQAIVKRRS